MRFLVTINDAPYGNERAYNAMRLANSLARREGVQAKVFLVADAAGCAKRGQQVPAGYYNLQTMITQLVGRGGSVGVCGSCMDARGIAESELIEGTRRSSLEEWATWNVEADKVLVF